MTPTTLGTTRGSLGRRSRLGDAAPDMKTASIAGSRLNSGGQGRNRTTDTRIFKTNHYPPSGWATSKKRKKFSCLLPDLLPATEPPTELL
jgi:hypothetical protein